MNNIIYPMFWKSSFYYLDARLVKIFWNCLCYNVISFWDRQKCKIIDKIIVFACYSAFFLESRYIYVFGTLQYQVMYCSHLLLFLMVNVFYYSLLLLLTFNCFRVAPMTLAHLFIEEGENFPKTPCRGSVGYLPTKKLFSLVQSPLQNHDSFTSE